MESPIGGSFSVTFTEGPYLKDVLEGPYLYNPVQISTPL